ncbi:hypothetical protein [Streptobacillus notomytis]|uniref:hypothetical protein n=1 Tax=Streptobacillus notomytis TaxID=1712031 RepID=UPI0009453ACB|nr:hypothetical protein [Streptobacillus notomytis]
MNKTQELRRHLKSSLKEKVSINDRTVIRYMMLGFIGVTTISHGAWLAINDGTGTVGKSGSSSNDGENNSKNNIILSKYDNAYNTEHSVIIGAGGKTYGKGLENVVIGFNAKSENKQSVVIGANTKSDLQNSVVLGSHAYVYQNHFNTSNGVSKDDGQGVAVGSAVFSTAQATSVGNNTYAIGRSSIAIGNDDVSSYTQSVTEHDYKEYFKKLYEKIDKKGEVYGYVSNGQGKTDDKKHKYSPTLAQGHGSVAYAPNSVILGINSRLWGDGGDSIIIGNDALITDLKKDGKVVDGHNGKSVLALGNKTNATLDNSVALGYLSATDYTQADLNKPGYTAKGSYSIPSSAKVGVISVGKKGHERRIINVASGYRDSDAVNVAQLKTLEDRLVEHNKRLEKANKDIKETIEELKERIKALEEI